MNKKEIKQLIDQAHNSASDYDYVIDKLKHAIDTPVIKDLNMTAKGKSCLVGLCRELDRSGRSSEIRLPATNDTVVLAHDSGAGVAMKHNDLNATFACAYCHAVIDGQVPRPSGYSQQDIKLMQYEAGSRYRSYLVESGFIQIEPRKAKNRGMA